jgi:Tol biopolymer transport system component
MNTRWSANGKWIAFTMADTSESENADTLNIIRPDGSDREMIFSPASPQFAWAGEKLLLRSLEDPAEFANPKVVIRSIDPESKDAQILFAPEQFGVMFVSPDGTTIAYTDQHNPTDPSPTKEIRLLDLSGNLIQSLGVYPNQFTGIFPVTWSPDGSLIAYNNFDNMHVAEIKPNPSPISVYQADASYVQPRIWSAVFSPQNTYLLMDVWDGINKLVAVSVDGQEQNVVAWLGQTLLEEFYFPSWRPAADL